MNKSFSANYRLPCVTLICMISMCVISNAQTSAPDYKNSPEWIKMIDNPNTNYFEAQKAYDTYWLYHEKPNGEEEEMKKEGMNSSSEKMSDKEKKAMERDEAENEKEREHDANKILTEADRQKLEQKREMIYQCKRFENWMLEVKPFVQSDGRILSKEERMEIYNKQMLERQK